MSSLDHPVSHVISRSKQQSSDIIETTYFSGTRYEEQSNCSAYFTSFDGYFYIT